MQRIRQWMIDHTPSRAYADPDIRDLAGDGPFRVEPAWVAVAAHIMGYWLIEVNGQLYDTRWERMTD